MEHSFGTTNDLACGGEQKLAESFAFHNSYLFVNKQYERILCQLLK